MTLLIAQYNVARARAELDQPVMASFVADLDRINRLADATPGFVWRLADSNGNTTSIRPYHDPLMLVTLSAWASREALWRFVYHGEHQQLLSRRRRWFHEPSGPSLVLWWVPAAHMPDIADAKERLGHLRRHGPTPHAFTFARWFGEPSEQLEAHEYERDAP